MRRITAFFLAMLMVFGFATQAFAATVSLEADKTAIKAGEQVVVTVKQNEALENVIAIEYRVFYNADLFQLTDSQLAANHDLGKTATNAKGTYQVINYLDKTSEGVEIPAGTVATLTFTAKEDISQEQNAAFELVNAGVMDCFGDMIEENMVQEGVVSITVAPAVAKTYTVTLPQGEGYTVTPVEGSENPVTEGGSYAFAVTVDTENYEGDPVVKANGLSLTQQDGVYTIYNITEDQTVTVEGIKEQGLPADKVVYQHGSNGAQWPSGAPVYIDTLTLKGLAVQAVSWDEAYENCTVTLHKKTALDASYSLAAMAGVSGNPQMISMFSADINGNAYTGGTFTYSSSLEEGRGEILVTAKAGNYSGTKTIRLVVDGAPEPAPETYTVTLTGGEGYTVAAAEDSFSPVTEGGSFSFTVSVNKGYQGTPVVKANGLELTAVNGIYTIANITSDQVVTVEGITAKGGYALELPVETSTSVSGEVTVELKVSHSEQTVSQYNAYDVTLSYDTENLTFVSAAAAHTGAEIRHNETAGTVQIVGYGEARSFGDALAALTFTAKASGIHNVTVLSAKVDNSGNAISDDAPDAAVPTANVQVKVAYAVTLPENFTGDPTVLPGADYQFTAPCEFYDITVTVGGEEVEPTVEGLVYTVPAVNGDVVVTATGKIYHVTKTGLYANITGEDTAQYDKDYTFAVTPEAGYMISNVSVKIGETEVEYTTDGNGSYVVPGKEIKGDLTVTATAAPAEGYTQITFTGVESSEVVGGLVQTAENGKDFSFRLNKEEGYYYTAMLGETRLSADAEGAYTIPGTEIKGDPLTVVITKTLLGTVNVEVSQYLTLNETVMWLVKATMDEQVLAYGAGNTMFWSEQYNTYCWLVISAESEDAVKAAAQAAVCLAEEGTVAPQVAYDGDVNQSGPVDVNDAQLTYDMYQAKLYEDFTRVAMDKFLEADINGDGVVNVEDAAAIVAQLLK